MKDLKFVANEAKGLKEDAVFRTDSFTIDGNVTILETYGLDDRRPTEIVTELQKKLLRFQKLDYPTSTFIDFAKENDLELRSMNSDGTGEETVLNEVASEAS